MRKPTGQQVIEAFEAWIGSFVRFPAVPGGQGLTLALWCLASWFAPKWPVAAYAFVTSDGPGCGKTTLLQVAMALSLNPKFRPTMRALETVRAIEQTAGRVTYFFDQVEALQAGNKVSDEQAILLSGYQKGAKHGITVGSKSVDFSTYCQKMFSCVGSIAPDLDSRCIRFRLSYDPPARSWDDEVMTREGEAAALLALAAQVLPGVGADDAPPTWTPPPTTLAGRDRQIWTPIYSVAHALRLDTATMRRLDRASSDNVEYKRSAERKRYRDLIQALDRTERDDHAERALRDLAAVLPEPVQGRVSGHIWTATAVERMKELDGPWRVYKGTGLTQDSLAALVSRWLGKTKVVREGVGRGAATGRGYLGQDVRRAVEALERSKQEGARDE